jgi:hypothetical protein
MDDIDAFEGVECCCDNDAGDMVDWNGVDRVDNTRARVQLNRSLQESDQEIVGAVRRIDY